MSNPTSNPPIKRFRVNLAGHAYEAADGCLVLFEDYERLTAALEAHRTGNTVRAAELENMQTLARGYKAERDRLRAALEKVASGARNRIEVRWAIEALAGAADETSRCPKCSGETYEFKHQPCGDIEIYEDWVGCRKCDWAEQK